MMDLQNKNCIPTMTDFEENIRNPVFAQFCAELTAAHHCKETPEYSACSMEKGWNLKFKKSGRNLCTSYPKEGCFSVMVVIGRKEQPAVEATLPDLCNELREVYASTREFNGQRWLMLSVEDKDAMYADTLRLIEIRSRK
ncbi:MAG: DUF3788 domain-containing protein [Oscillospiraceae bacterium]|nr:DUF3788 domain-containing protein [Oscillospiraceae bacterium]